MGELYIVATPIGNLKDITLRALEVLRQADFILAEDTRVTGKLLERYEIKKELISYHQHASLNKTEYIIALLKGGKRLALVSDSGTPGISDPGAKLVKEVFKKTNASIIPIPGASAVTALASVAGFSMDKFLFLGFAPTKNKRKRFFEEVASSKYPVVLYESRYRIFKTIRDLKGVLMGEEIVLGREITKKFETILRGNLTEIEEALNKSEVKGEFVLIIKNG